MGLVDYMDPLTVGNQRGGIPPVATSLWAVLFPRHNSEKQVTPTYCLPLPLPTLAPISGTIWKEACWALTLKPQSLASLVNRLISV